MQEIPVLLVDDEVDVLDILSLRLKRRGILPYTAANGQDALKILETTSVRVVILDVKMPEMDGIAVLSIIRKEYPELNVIMLSGHADMEVAAQGIQMGAFSYLLKPVDIDTLCHKIEDACRQQALDNPSS